MNNYTVKNCATDNLDTFRANVKKCIAVLKEHRTAATDQIVLQSSRDTTGARWNFFISITDNGQFSTAWQLDDNGRFDDFNPEAFNTADEVIAEYIQDGETWKATNLMEVTW